MPSPAFYSLNSLTIQAEPATNTQPAPPDTWPIQPGEHWAIVGGTEQQRLSFINQLKHSLSGSFAEVSLAEQQRWINNELLKDDSDITDKVFHGTPLLDLLHEQSKDNQQALTLLEQFQISHLANTGFKYLSSGETRKALIISALLQKPDRLILNNVLEGIDAQSKQLTENLIANSFNENQSRNIIFFSNRLTEQPPFITHILFVRDQQFTCLNTGRDNHIIQQLLKTTTLTAQAQPDLPERLVPQYTSNPDNILVRMQDIAVSYTDKPLPCLSAVNLTVREHQHWQITGNNGSGKTTLLKLITGDHPQAFNNAIEVFGKLLGNGVSIWERKKPIGHMSTEIFWSHQGFKLRILGTALSTIVSGFYDSIGLYQKPHTQEIDTARQWLELIGLKDKAKKNFTDLSPCDQRMVLIARAMVKQPRLLLLDEPCSGLDTQQRRIVINLIEALIAQKKTTLIYVCHEAEERIDAIEHQLHLA